MRQQTHHAGLPVHADRVVVLDRGDDGGQELDEEDHVPATEVQPSRVR